MYCQHESNRVQNSCIPWLYGKGKFIISSGRIAEVKLIIVSATAMIYKEGRKIEADVRDAMFTEILSEQNLTHWSEETLPALQNLWIRPAFGGLIVGVEICPEHGHHDNQYQRLSASTAQYGKRSGLRFSQDTWLKELRILYLCRLARYPLWTIETPVTSDLFNTKLDKFMK